MNDHGGDQTASQQRERHYDKHDRQADDGDCGLTVIVSITSEVESGTEGVADRAERTSHVLDRFDRIVDLRERIPRCITQPEETSVAVGGNPALNCDCKTRPDRGEDDGQIPEIQRTIEIDLGEISRCVFMGEENQRQRRDRTKSDSALYSRTPHYKANYAAARFALLPRSAADAGIHPRDAYIQDDDQNHRVWGSVRIAGKLSMVVQIPA